MGWKIDSLGISSKDFYGQDRSGARALYGSKWKFASDGAHQAAVSEKIATVSSPKSVAKTPPKAPVEAAQAVVGGGDVLSSDPAASAVGAYTLESLMAKKKPEVVEIAASFGVVDLTGTKEQLAQAIVDRQ